MPSVNDVEAKLRQAAAQDLKPTRVPGTFRIAQPLLPAGAGPTSVSTRHVVRILSEALPYCAIWLEAHDADVLRSVKRATSAEALPGAPHWVFLKADEAQQLLPALYRGAWGLFFAASDSLSHAAPARLTFDETEVPALTSGVGADASVISWHDDSEWLVCVLNAQSPASER